MITDRNFGKMVAEAVGRLPEHVREKIENVAFIAEDEARPKGPGESGIMLGQVLLGLYEGVPKTERGQGYFGVLPDRIFIFRKPIEDICDGNLRKMKDFVYQVVWHEVGHHLGFKEDEIRKLESERFPDLKLEHE